MTWMKIFIKARLQLFAKAVRSKGLGDAGCQEHDAAEIGAPAFAGEAQEVARTLVQRGGLADAARSSCGRPNGRHAWHAAGSAAHRCQKAAARPIGCE
jgi:hypothetical protein